MFRENKMLDKEIYIPKVIDGRKRVGEPTIIKVESFYSEEELNKAFISLNRWKDEYLGELK